jgi:hypothetical protein
MRRQTLKVLLLSSACMLIPALGLGASGPAGLETGSRLPNLLLEARVRNLPVDVAAPSRGWVVYFFSPESAASQENGRRAERLASGLPSEWTLLAVAGEDEGLDAFLQSLHVTSPVLSQISRESLARYRFSKTPRIYILDAGWKLVEVLDGPFQGKSAKKLSARLNIPVALFAPQGAPHKSESSTGPNATSQRVGKFPRDTCLDRQQRPYSSGAKANAFGLTFLCGTGGAWAPLP